LAIRWTGAMFAGALEETSQRRENHAVLFARSSSDLVGDLVKRANLSS
jgi:hypothetical protein